MLVGYARVSTAEQNRRPKPTPRSMRGMLAEPTGDAKG